MTIIHSWRLCDGFLLFWVSLLVKSTRKQMLMIYLCQDNPPKEITALLWKAIWDKRAVIYTNWLDPPEPVIDVCKWSCPVGGRLVDLSSKPTWVLWLCLRKSEGSGLLIFLLVWEHQTAYLMHMVNLCFPNWKPIRLIAAFTGRQHLIRHWDFPTPYLLQ